MFTYFRAKTFVGAVHVETLNQFKTELGSLKKFFDETLSDHIQPKKPLRELSEKSKAILNKRVNDKLINTLGQEIAVEEVATKVEESKTVEANDVKKVEKKADKKIVAPKTLDDICQSLDFNSRTHRDLVYKMLGDLKELRSHIDTAYKSGDNDLYNIAATCEAECSRRLSVQTRDWVSNVLSSLEKAEKLESNDKTDYKSFDEAIRSHINRIVEVRKVIDPFTPTCQLAVEGKAMGMKK